MEITSRINGTLGLGKIPGRKRTALYRTHGCSFDPIAYIADDEDVAWLERFLLALCAAAGAEDGDGVTGGYQPRPSAGPTKHPPRKP